jgi:hypothetical protein
VSRFKPTSPLLRLGLITVWAAVCVVTTTGCGGNRPPLKKMSGQVLLDGKPLTKGSVRIAPADMRPAYGNLDGEGRFTLTTYEVGDGVAYGTHPVAVSSFEIRGPDDRQVREWSIPPKYGDTKSSGLTATIDDDTEELVLELSWGQEKGPVIEQL